MGVVSTFLAPKMPELPVPKSTEPTPVAEVKVSSNMDKLLNSKLNLLNHGPLNPAGLFTDSAAELKRRAREY
jgi:hypothetical protein